MKKAIRIFSVTVLMILLSVPLYAFAETAETNPVLTEISFKNAVINEDFTPYTNDYTITLEDPSVTPALKSYAIDGEAEIFVTYHLDETKHQTGIIVTLEYNSGTNVYNFTYTNALTYQESDNNLLSGVNCKYGEVYPAISDKLTDYKLYIPSDLTVLHLSAVTQDVSAYYDLPKEISLSADQEPSISIMVTASNGDTRIYHFKIKRLKKTTEEVIREMANPDFESLVKGEFFYQKPTFAIALISAAGGLVLILFLLSLAKKIIVRAEDPDEPDFFAQDSEEETA